MTFALYIVHNNNKQLENMSNTEQKETRHYTEEEIDIFYYLNDLRDSGIVNMYGATPYIVREYGVSKQEARTHLKQWMKIFNADGYEHLHRCKLENDEE